MDNYFNFETVNGNQYEITFTDSNNIVTFNHKSGYVCLRNVINNKSSIIGEWNWSDQDEIDSIHLSARLINKKNAAVHSSFTSRILAYELLKDFLKGMDSLYSPYNRHTVVHLQQQLNMGKILRTFEVLYNYHCDYLVLEFEDKPKKMKVISGMGFTLNKVKYANGKETWWAIPISDKNMLWMGFWEQSGENYRESILSNEYIKL